MQPHMVKRMIFMFCVMFPVLLYAEYTGRNSVMVAGIVGGVCSGVSFLLFPDPNYIKNLDKDGKDNQSEK